MSIFRDIEVSGNLYGITTSKGQIIVNDGEKNVGLPIGANGYVLKYNNAAPMGIAWEEFSSALAVIQVSRDTNVSLTTSYADVTFNNIDLQTESSILDRDVINTDRILIGANGYYLITYVTEAEDASIRITLNDGGVALDGSERSVKVPSTDVAALTASFMKQLSDGDYITLQAKGNVDIVYNITLTVTKLDGVVGASGPQGPAGPSGDITWQGTWNSGTSYIANDAVYYNGSTYIALQANSNTLPTTLSPNWGYIAQAGIDGNTFSWTGSWNTSSTYTPQQVVNYQNSAYIALSENTNVIPTSSLGVNWDILAQKGTNGVIFNWTGTWGSSTNYYINDVVQYNGASYIAITDNINIIPTTSLGVDWDIVAQKGTNGSNGTNGTNGTSFTWNGIWSSLTSYSQNDVVEYNGSSYIALASNTNVIPTSSLGVNWDLVTQKGSDGTQGDIVWQGAWNSGTAYIINDTVQYEGSTYIAISSNTNQNPIDFPSSWNLIAAGAGDNLIMVQSRRSTAFTPTGSYTNITLNNTDIETDPTLIKHDDVNTDRIYVYKTGLYTLEYNAVCENATMRLQINGTTAITESINIITLSNNARGVNHCKVTRQLTTGDYVTLQALGTKNILNPIVLSVIKAESVQGPQGPAGVQGPAGDINWTGVWDSGTSYLINDTVYYNGSSYVALTNHSNIIPTSSLGVDWDLIAQAGDNGNGFNWMSTWSSITTYNEDDVVYYGGSSYIALQTNLNVLPTTLNPNWAIVAQAGTNGTSGTIFTWQGAWDSGTSYSINDVVNYSNSSYIALVGNTNVIPTTSLGVNWDIVAQKGTNGTNGVGFVWQGTWSSGTTYAQNDVVYYSGSSYIALGGSTGVAPTTSLEVDWDLYTQKGSDGANGDIVWQGTWSSGTSYVANDTVEYNGSTYIAIASSTAQVPFNNPTYWELVAQGVDTELAIVQARRTTNFTPTGSFTNITLNSTDIETKPTIIEQDNTNTERINILKTGLYSIEYRATAESATFQLQKNGTTDLTESTQIVELANGDRAPVSGKTIINLVNGDYVTLQAQGTADILAPIILTVTKIDAAPGEKGNNGAPGDIIWRGAWSSSTPYIVNDTVQSGGSSYVCINDNTNFVPPNATYWQLLAQKGTNGTGFSWQGTWDNATGYSIRDVVYYEGTSYVALGSTTNNQPDLNIGTYWDIHALRGVNGTSFVWQGLWDSGTSYSINDVAEYNGSSYVSLGNSNTNNIPTSTLGVNWDLMAEKGNDGTNGDIAWKGAWVNSTSYVIHDTVSYQGSSYVCILGNINKVPTNTLYWDIVAQKGDLQIPYSEVVAITLTSTISTAYTVIDGMTQTPSAGTYFASFSCDVNGTIGDQVIDFGIFVDGTIHNGSQRQIGGDTDNSMSNFQTSVHTQGIVVVNGSQAVDVRYKTDAITVGAISIRGRNLILLQVL